MRLFLTMFLLFLPFGIVCGADSPIAVKADELHNKGKYAEAQKLLLGSVPGTRGGKELAELYWRAARETLELADFAETEKKPKAEIMAQLAKGEGHADKAIAADPKNDLGYYYKAVTMGRWGEVKGIRDAFARAGPMKELLVKELSINPERTDPYFVLALLYRVLPGWPMSFGSIDAAVSLGRKAVELRQAQVKAGTEKELVYNFYNELARSLYKRNWSQAKRMSEQKKKAAKVSAARTPLEKGSLFEATIVLKQMSDRAEAKALAQLTVNTLGKMSSLTAPQAKDFQKAKVLLAGW